MYSAGSHCWVGWFTTVLSLPSSSQSLLSDSSFYCLSFLFLDPQQVVNRSQSWVGVSTSCHFTGAPLISPMWQLHLAFISPIWNHTVWYFLFKLLLTFQDLSWAGAWWPRTTVFKNAFVIHNVYFTIFFQCDFYSGRNCCSNLFWYVPWNA